MTGFSSALITKLQFSAWHTDDDVGHGSTSMRRVRTFRRTTALGPMPDEFIHETAGLIYFKEYSVPHPPRSRVQ